MFLCPKQSVSHDLKIWTFRAYPPEPIFVLVNYTYLVGGIFPTQPMVAWWGHLIGFGVGSMESTVNRYFFANKY
ncbi:MAG: hypothetical protein ACO3NK_15575 [Prochlorotrichaceae cyanobacterium]|jgi:membrane associated rhomboid family serine protease